MSMRKRIGLAAISLAILATPALAGSVDFYHDKANWQDAFAGVLGKPEAGAEVKVVPYADTSTYQAAVRASLRTPSAPGIFTWWSGYRMKDLVDAGLVADVSALWKKYTDAGLYNPSLASAYTFNGKIYGIPDLVAYWVVFYNKKVFDKYQLTPPKTWAELEKVAADPEGEQGHAVRRDRQRPLAELHLVRGAPRPPGSRPLRQADERPGEVHRSRRQAGLRYLEGLDRQGLLHRPVDRLRHRRRQRHGRRVRQGQSRHDPGRHLVRRARSPQAGMSADDIGAFIMPNEKDGMGPAVIFETGPLLLAASSAQKDDAMKVADYWMSAKAQQAWVDAQDFPPVNKDVKAKSALIAGLAKEIIDGKYNQINRFWEATPPEIAEAAVDELGNFMVHPDQADQVMQNLQALADKYWAAHK